MILSAIALPILVMAIGFAADFGYASYINQRLARAADTAALSAVSQSAATAVGGYGNTTWLQIYGNSIFQENIKQLPVSGVTTSLTVVSDGNGGVIATASYSYPVKPLFGGLIGKTSIPVSGTIQSSAKPITYVNYYILVDTSQSMGIATSQADMIALYNRVVANNNSVTSDAGCVFGCHVLETQNGKTQKYTNEDLAHNSTYGPKITLRIDSAVTAIQSMISTAASVTGAAKNVRFSLYLIQADPLKNTYITPVSSSSTPVTYPSNDYTSLSTLAATITLGNNTSSGLGDSDFTSELAVFNNNNILPATNGSGASPTSPLNFVFLITDGLFDSCGSSHCTGAIDSSKCSPIKSKATVGVIYTIFQPIVKDPNKQNPVFPADYQSDYQNLVYPYKDQIEPALQACATSLDYYFTATYGNEIQNAVQALFNKTLPASARLVQ